MTAPKEIRNKWWPTADTDCSNGWTASYAHGCTTGIPYIVSLYIRVNKTGSNPSVHLHFSGAAVSGSSSDITITDSQRVTLTTTCEENSNIGCVAGCTDCTFTIVKPVCVQASDWDTLTSLNLPDNFFNYATQPE